MLIVLDCQHLFHSGDGSSVTRDSQEPSILFQFFKNVLEVVRFIAGQQVSQFGADILINADFGNVFANQFSYATNVASVFFDDDQMVACTVLLL